MASAQNTIVERQNQPLPIRRLAAQRQAYSKVKWVFAAHAVLTVPVAVAWTLTLVERRDLAPYGIAWAFTVSLADVLWLQPWQARLRQTGARIQEALDSDLFEMPPATLKTGSEIPMEVIAAYASEYEQKEPGLASLKNWYPIEFAELPLPVARIACQLMNIGWDSSQRRIYAGSILAILVLLTLVLVAIGIGRGTSLVVVVVSVLAFLSPAILLFARQYKENTDADARLKALYDHGRSLWQKALDAGAEQELLAGSRSLQDELFEHRRKNAPIFDWFYRMLRNKNELTMRAAAQLLVEEWRSRKQATPKA